ncbi:MAG: hypothetical protein QM778_18855 [Myxococcales bacterium]
MAGMVGFRRGHGECRALSKVLLLAALGALLACDPTEPPASWIVAHDSDAGNEGADAGRDGAANPPGDDPDEVDPDPILCGGAYKDPCAEGKYCDWTDGCGTAGNCFTRDGCDLGGDHVICGCDGKTYMDDCVAYQQGVSMAHEGPCLDKARQFSCGRFTCDNGSYCLDLSSAHDERSQERFVCLPLPTGCSPDKCDCKQKLDGACYVSSTCSVEGNHLVVTCK